VAQLTQQCSEAVQAADARLAAAHAELLAAQAEKARAQTAMGDLALVLGPLSKRVRRCVERRVGESFDQFAESFKKSAAWRCDNCAELEEEETCTCWKEEEEYADFKPFKEELLALLRPIREALEEGRHANAVAELAKMGPSAHSSPLPVHCADLLQIVGAAKKTADYMDADDCAAPWDVDACRVALCVAREVMAYLNEASDVAVAFNDPGVVRLTPALAAVDIYAALLAAANSASEVSATCVWPRAHYLVDSDFDHAAKREGDGNGDGDLTGFSTTAFCSNAIPEQLLHLAALWSAPAVVESLLRDVLLCAPHPRSESLNTSWVSADTLVQAIGSCCGWKSEAIKFVIEVAHSALDAEAQANPPVAYLNGPQYRALLSAAHEGLEVTAAETGHAKEMLRASARRSFARTPSATALDKLLAAEPMPMSELFALLMQLPMQAGSTGWSTAALPLAAKVLSVVVDRCTSDAEPAKPVSSAEADQCLKEIVNFLGQSPPECPDALALCMRATKVRMRILILILIRILMQTTLQNTHTQAAQEGGQVGEGGQAQRDPAVGGVRTACARR